jgi:Rieske Fe-S protein
MLVSSSKNLYSFDNYKSELKKPGFINRKEFIRLITLAFAAAFIAMWQILTKRQKQLSEVPVISRVDASKLGLGVFFFDNFILVKSSEGLKVFSNLCTHAGCKINRETNGQLICPCHGSRYEAATGKVLQGPAGLSLPLIAFSTDLKTGEIIIKN